MLRKNWDALGSFVKEDRPRALDLLGFSVAAGLQHVLPNILVDLERRDDPDLAYGVARAHNRAIVDFCSADRRLLAVGYVPLADFERARAMAEASIALGCKGAARALRLPEGSLAEPHGTFARLGGGAGSRAADRASRRRRRAPARSELLSQRAADGTDFHGGAENFRSSTTWRSLSTDADAERR